jgi:hypothetical protein
MIISASRRTDIPAFYATWFMKRLRAGYCLVPNPFNRNQVSRVSLKPQDVDVIVFWTRDPVPMMPHLKELDQRGYRYYFLYTVVNYPRPIDPKSPSLAFSLKAFRRLAEYVGPEKVIWRYDPILFSSLTGPKFHEETFRYIAKTLRGSVKRSVISTVNLYRKTRRRLKHLYRDGVELAGCNGEPLSDLMKTLACTARECDMTIYSCAETPDLKGYGIPPGKCVDNMYVKDTFGIDVTHRKDPSQREACGCVVSKDIGMYDSCLYGCVYCYATSSFELAKMNHERHDPDSPSLIGFYEFEANRMVKNKGGILQDSV